MTCSLVPLTILTLASVRTTDRSIAIAVAPHSSDVDGGGGLERCVKYEGPQFRCALDPDTSSQPEPGGGTLASARPKRYQRKY